MLKCSVPVSSVVAVSHYCHHFLLGSCTNWRTQDRMAFIGAGVLLLCVVWAITIIVCVLLLRFEGPLTYASVAVVAAAVLLTVILWIKYRSDVQERELELELKMDTVIYDYSVVGRTAVLAVTATALLVGMLSVFTFHVTVPRTASRLPPWNAAFQ